MSFCLNAAEVVYSTNYSESVSVHGEYCLFSRSALRRRSHIIVEVKYVLVSGGVANVRGPVCRS